MPTVSKVERVQNLETPEVSFINNPVAQHRGPALLKQVNVVVAQ